MMGVSCQACGSAGQPCCGNGGSARFNYGSENYKIPVEAIEKRDRLHAVAARYGVDLRTAALQFSIAPDVAVALVVGCANPQQALADYTSLKTAIPPAFWSHLRSEDLIEDDVAIPGRPLSTFR